MYQNLYNLIETYIFNGSIVAGSHQELVVVLLSTLGAIAVVALPFFIIFKLAKNLIG